MSNTEEHIMNKASINQLSPMVSSFKYVNGFYERNNQEQLKVIQIFKTISEDKTNNENFNLNMHRHIKNYYREEQDPLIQDFLKTKIVKNEFFYEQLYFQIRKDALNNF